MAGLLKGVRVLLVDDDEETLEICVLILSAEGADVATVTKASDACVLLRERDFDVLVSDIAMPEDDGYWLIEQVRALQSEVSAIPALALSAHASAATRHGCLCAGYQRHVAKPFEPEDLVASVRSLLN